MRKLDTREQTLAIVFGGLIGGIVGLVLLGAVLGSISKSQKQLAGVQRDVAASRLVLSERSVWDARLAWLKEHPAELYRGQESGSQFAEQVQRSLRSRGLSIESQELLDPLNEDAYVIGRLDLRVSGTFRSLVEWLQATQQPGQYVAISQFEVEATSEDSSNMVIKLQLRKLWKG